MTLLAVVGMLAGIAGFLWLSTLLETRQLGPLVDGRLDALVDTPEPVEVMRTAA
jgi:hypothetical protein